MADEYALLASRPALAGVVCREACTEESETAKSGTDEQNQAQRIAMIYSLLGTCKANGIDPLQWLTHVVNELPNRK